MRVRMRIWLEEDGQVLYGQGRQLLLKALQDTGSLAGAARQLKMSYRGAWGRLKASEDRIGFKLVERSPEGRRAMQLTKEAEELIKRFDQFRERADKFQAKIQKELFSDLAKTRITKGKTSKRRK